MVKKRRRLKGINPKNICLIVLVFLCLAVLGHWHIEYTPSEPKKNLLWQRPPKQDLVNWSVAKVTTQKVTTPKPTPKPVPESLWNKGHFHLINYTNIYTLKPPKFDSSYKNPCWMTPTKVKAYINNTVVEVPGEELQCLPFFMLAGFPMCGTRDLISRIAAHPDIEISQKAPHWWTRKQFNNMMDLQGYLNHNKEATNVIQKYSVFQNGANIHSKITGDVSVSTFWDNDVWRQLPGNQKPNQSEPSTIIADVIAHVLPKVRVIIAVRNPIERLYSDYIAFSRDKPKSAAAFHDHVDESISAMKDCIAQLSTRACVYDRTLSSDMGVRLRIGMYPVYVRDWLRVVPRRQLHVVRLEEYAANPRKELEGVYSFLGLEPLQNEFLMSAILNMPRINRTKHYVEREPVLPETREMLTQFYLPYIKDLADILKDHSYLNLWMPET